jgi:hypothetical protein
MHYNVGPIIHAWSCGSDSVLIGGSPGTSGSATRTSTFVRVLEDVWIAMAGEIPFRALGRAGVKVSALGVGGHHLGDANQPNVF